MNNKSYVIIFLVLASCSFFKKRTTSTEIFEEIKCLTISNNINNFLYNDFPDRDRNNGGCDIKDDFVDGYCDRFGTISNEGYKDGFFVTGIHHYDTIKNIKVFDRIFKEEYFKHGLRDSIFKQYDINGKIIYETMFKMGTGLWKEFHANGKTYFEAYTQDGYFTDTLKLYNREGVNFEKRFYQKDTLVYYVGNDNWCLKYRYKPDNDTYLEVDSYNQKDLKQGTFRNTFRYKTKEEFEDDYFARNTLKR
ncbi:toxin-antitoxin system YwqK family antitoxin [Flavobacterium salmonis]|nr:hypothetical protein [Flavobacterium salmonis]